jgi:hypothetical protein
MNRLVGSAFIPAADKAEWRDPAVADAYASQTLATDRTASSSGNPPSVRIPIGYQLDAFNLSLGRPLFASKDIRVAVLVVRGELDFWSRPADLSALARCQRSTPAAAGIPGHPPTDPSRGRAPLAATLTK